MSGASGPTTVPPKESGDLCDLKYPFRSQHVEVMGHRIHYAFEPKSRLPFRLMRGPTGFSFVQAMNMMVKKVIPENCPITDEGLRYYLLDADDRLAPGEAVGPGARFVRSVEPRDRLRCR